MWPFSRPESSNEALIELKSRCVELLERQRDLDQRFKMIEREHEDLHRAYRKLRASAGAEAKETSRNRAGGDPGGNGEVVSKAMTKEELRKKFLTPGFATRPLDQQ